MPMSRILITGGAGFIGSHLVSACLAAGHEVHLVVRPGSNDDRIRHFGRSVIRHSFDLQSETALKRCVCEVLPEQIFHLAASPRRPEDPEFADVRDGIREHLQGLVNLLSAAAAARQSPEMVIRAGSLAEYGLAPSPYTETSREAPLTVYGAEMAAATHLIGGLQSRLPFPVVTARFALVYGGSQSTDYLLPLLIRRCLAGEPSAVRHPNDRRDLIYVGDAIDALLRMAATPLPGATIVNVASGVAPTMRELAQLVVKHTGADPDLVDYGPENRSSGIADLRGSPEMAHALLGWKARIPLSEGLERTIEWYREVAEAAGASRRERSDVSQKMESERSGE